ncbi:class D sortase [Clostridium sp.]|uniref:class D sortase n=1 Tax=Clostridium sp. TaxID=1506 RepID=UPI002A920CBC|nr:class D sortase [Clostridium sp.]MDY6012176.1 class D sortase [Clostridium sp.]
MKKYKNKFFTLFAVLLIFIGIIFVAYPFVEIQLDKKSISKNIDEWDKQKAEIVESNKDYKDKHTNDINNIEKDKENETNSNKDKNHTIKLDGREIVGKIIEPNTNKQIPIIMGATEENLLGGAALYDNGVFPGDKGTAIILGHRETTFGFLKNIKKSDIIEVQTLDNLYKFKVKKTYITTPEDESILAQEEGPSMTLVTCYPFRYVGSAPERFIVKLDLIK